MKLKPLYYITGLLMLVGSCTVTDKELVYLDKIDKLGNALDSVALQYYAIDTNKFFYVNNLINRNLSRLSTKDTILSDTVKIYASIQKSFKRFISEHDLILDEIKYSRNQLHSLRKDIKNGRINEMQMEKYFQEEKEAVSILMQKISFNVQNIAFQLKSFAQMNDSVGFDSSRIENR
jgi:hypothetical protein